ncbi:MAG: hypothetical protein GXO77_10795 [Calditrichaeota bacterium]|nr:hypothetical protein [Calditrichota bacterium]
MKTLLKIIGLVLIINYSMLFASDGLKQEKTDAAKEKSPALWNAQRFALIHTENLQQKPDLKSSEFEKKKSGVKAAFLSAFIPGAGEAYAGSYWKAALFAALEIGFWTANAVYNNKGDKEDQKMKQFGDRHWDERVYWSYVYKVALREGKWNGPELNGYEDSQGRFVIDEKYYNQDLISQLYEMQDDLGFTHSLPMTKTQQYYEMIYKYLHQFGVGWDDVASTYGDPYFYENPANLGKLTPNINLYRTMRNKSNEYYDMATTMVSLVLANHLLSAFDAAWTVKKYNIRLSQAVRLQPDSWSTRPMVTYGLSIQW